MKKFLLSLILMTTVLLANDAHSHEHHHHHSDGYMHKSIQCTTQKKYKNPSLEVLEVMHSPMMCKKWVESGDVNRDYLENMIPHHMGAILSSQALLKYTKNDRLREIARAIISTQKQEIAEFKELLTNLSKQEVANYQAFNHKAKQDMHKMMKEMEKIKGSDDVDKDFLSAMIAHHQGAIKASKQILEVSNNDRVREIARGIISTQKQEIADFKRLLKGMK